MLPDASIDGGAGAPRARCRTQRRDGLRASGCRSGCTSAPAATRLARGPPPTRPRLRSSSRRARGSGPRRAAVATPPASRAVVVLDEDHVVQAVPVVRAAAVAHGLRGRRRAGPAPSCACRGSGSACPTPPRRSDASRSRSRTCAGGGSGRPARPVRIARALAGEAREGRRGETFAPAATRSSQESSGSRSSKTRRATGRPETTHSDFATSSPRRARPGRDGRLGRDVARDRRPRRGTPAGARPAPRRRGAPSRRRISFWGQGFLRRSRPCLDLAAANHHSDRRRVSAARASRTRSGRFRFFPYTLFRLFVTSDGRCCRT